MLILSCAFLLLAAAAAWLTSVHPARNVLRLRRTLVSFFLFLGALSLGAQAMWPSESGPPDYGVSQSRR
jgi:hypothetical protein